MELPPLRKKMAKERAAVRNKDGDLTVALFGDHAILDADARGAMQPQNEQPTDQVDLIKSLIAAIQEQTAALQSLDGNGIEELEQLFLQVKALTYGKPTEATQSQPGEDGKIDGQEETIYP